VTSGAESTTAARITQAGCTRPRITVQAFLEPHPPRCRRPLRSLYRPVARHALAEPNERLDAADGEPVGDLGERLLAFTLLEAMDAAEQLGLWGVKVQAKHESAREFYARYGFRPLVGDSWHVYISLKTVRKSFA